MLRYERALKLFDLLGILFSKKIKKINVSLEQEQVLFLCIIKYLEVYKKNKIVSSTLFLG